MDLNKKEQKIADSSIEFIKDNRDMLIEKFANDDKYPKQENPVSFFMAGSFGAGKTEFSKRLAEKFEGLVLIDADRIRELCPKYDGKKAYIFNGAAFVGQEKLQDYALENNKSFVFDSAFFNYDKAKENIERSLSRSRPIEIYYVFQHPKVAWLFTQIRADIEGRYIEKEVFVDSFLQSWEVIHTIKKEFNNDIKLNLVEKSTNSDLTGININDLSDNDLEHLKEEVSRKQIKEDLNSLDEFINFDYSKSKLIKEL